MKQETQSLSLSAAGKGVRSGKRELLFERQGKNLYQSESSGLLIQEFKLNGVDEEKKSHGRNQGLDVVRNDISSYLFDYLEGFHIPTHFVRKHSATEMLVKRVEILPLCIRIMNIGNVELAKRLDLSESRSLDFPIVEHYYTTRSRNSSWVNEYHVYALGIATAEEFKQINRVASKVNAILRGLCDRRQLLLASLQLEFGRFKGQIVLTDELSPVTCHFLDLAIDNKSPGDRFLPQSENAEMALRELCDRLMLKV